MLRRSVGGPVRTQAPIRFRLVTSPSPSLCDPSQSYPFSLRPS